MNLVAILFWVLIGALLALAVLTFQRWSVNNVHPSRPRKSKRLIVGGAIIRWLLVATFFISAGFHATYSLITVFISFMFFRVIILAKWQSRLTKIGDMSTNLKDL